MRPICQHNSLPGVWLVQRVDRELDRPFYLRGEHFLQEVTE